MFIICEEQSCNLNPPYPDPDLCSEVQGWLSFSNAETRNNNYVPWNANPLCTSQSFHPGFPLKMAFSSFLWSSRFKLWPAQGSKAEPKCSVTHVICCSFFCGVLWDLIKVKNLEDTWSGTRKLYSKDLFKSVGSQLQEFLLRPLRYPSGHHIYYHLHASRRNQREKLQQDRVMKLIPTLLICCAVLSLAPKRTIPNADVMLIGE